MTRTGGLSCFGDISNLSIINGKFDTRGECPSIAVQTEIFEAVICCSHWDDTRWNLKIAIGRVHGCEGPDVLRPALDVASDARFVASLDIHLASSYTLA